MAKQFKITVNSPVQIIGGYTVDSDMIVVVSITDFDESPSSHDLINYKTGVYVSQVAKNNDEPMVMAKGLIEVKETSRGIMYRQYKGSVKSTDITYNISIASGKRKLTPASLTSLKENIAGVVAGFLGKNVNDLTIS